MKLIWLRTWLHARIFNKQEEKRESMMQTKNKIKIKLRLSRLYHTVSTVCLIRYLFDEILEINKLIEANSSTLLLSIPFVNEKIMNLWCQLIIEGNLFQPILGKNDDNGSNSYICVNQQAPSKVLITHSLWKFLLQTNWTIQNLSRGFVKIRSLIKIFSFIFAFLWVFLLFHDGFILWLWGEPQEEWEQQWGHRHDTERNPIQLNHWKKKRENVNMHTQYSLYDFYLPDEERISYHILWMEQ